MKTQTIQQNIVLNQMTKLLVVLILFIAQCVQAESKQTTSLKTANVYNDEMIDAIESLGTDTNAGTNNEKYLFPVLDAHSAFITTDVQSQIDLIKPIATENSSSSIDSGYDL